MTAPVSSLMGLGMPGPLAAALGETIRSVTAVGTTQGGTSPRIYASDFAILTTAASQTAATLDSGFPVGEDATVYNNTATAAVLFPPTGCTIDNGSANASVAIAQNRGRVVRRVSPTAFLTFYGA